MKKNILFFVFEEFADWQTAYALTEIKKTNLYSLKVVNLTKEPVTAASGMRILPDLDFIPQVDLADIDRFNTAMIILPGSNTQGASRNELVYPLVIHGLISNIPIAVIGNACHWLAALGAVSHQLVALVKAKSLSISIGNIILASANAPIEFAKTIIEVLCFNRSESTPLPNQSVNTLHA